MQDKTTLTVTYELSTLESGEFDFEILADLPNEEERRVVVQEAYARAKPDSIIGPLVMDAARGESRAVSPRETPAQLAVRLKFKSLKYTNEAGVIFHIKQ